MHNHIDENEVLRDALSGLNEVVPPMPEGLHAAWMQKVEEDQMEDKRIEKARSRKAFTRFLSIAAAMVFVIGGTLLTRDDLERQARTEKAYQDLVTQNDAQILRAWTAEEFKLALADYDSAAANTTSFTMTRSTGADMGAGVYGAETQGMTLMAKGASYDIEEAGVPEADAVQTGKKIIRTASLTIQTQTYDLSLTNLKAMCEAEGGWLESSSESQNSSTGLRTARLTLRIPQSALDGYLLGTEELGRITSRSENATDVTASYQDTQTRLNTQLALMERLQALITESADLSDLLALESQIADTQYQIDTLQSSLNATDRQVTYSTVSVTLREETAPALTDTTVSLGERIAAAVRMGCGTLVDFLQDMLVFIVAALPYIGVVAAFAVVITLARRLKRRKNS